MGVLAGEKLFKIMRVPDGLFSTGGACPRFTKKGKNWRQRGHITSHMNQLSSPAKIYADCRIVEYELTMTEIDSMAVSSYVELIRQRKVEDEQKRKEAQKAAELNRQRQTYLELKKKFEPK